MVRQSSPFVLKRSRRTKKPIKARRRWVINPKTRIVKSERIYKRSKLKEELKKIYGEEER